MKLKINFRKVQFVCTAILLLFTHTACISEASDGKNTAGRLDYSKVLAKMWVFVTLMGANERILPPYRAAIKGGQFR